jgi:hypothetical protein
MAEDNSARLQAMQDAVTDAGNDVRALKVRARSPDLFFIVSGIRRSRLHGTSDPRPTRGRPRFRSPD